MPQHLVLLSTIGVVQEGTICLITQVEMTPNHIPCELGQRVVNRVRRTLHIDGAAFLL
jgi:hypothetical protein